MNETSSYSWLKMTTLSRGLLLSLLWGLVSVALLDPADQILHMKVPFFAGVMMIWFWRSIGNFRVPISVWTAVIAIAVLIPLSWTVVGIVQSQVNASDAPFALLKSFLFVALLPVVLGEDIDLIALIMRLSLLIALLTLLVVLCSVYAKPLFLGFYAFSLDKDNAIINSSRDVFGLGLGQFYYKTSPVMILPFTYYAQRLLTRSSRRFVAVVMLIVYGLALLLSGTRANILAGLFSVGILVLIHARRRLGITAAVALTILMACISSAVILLHGFDPHETSNAVKLGHLYSYVQEFHYNKTSLLWGEGAGSAFYSIGYHKWTTVTELTYFELIRVFGLPMAVLLGIGLLWIAWKLAMRRAWVMFAAYLGYLAISATNPLLISSTGILVICGAWKEVLLPSSQCSAFHFQSTSSLVRPESLPTRAAISHAGRRRGDQFVG